MTDELETDDLEEWLAWSDGVRDNPPAAPEGFVLIECDATPRHWPTYTVRDDYGYPAPCLYCASWHDYDADLRKAHSRHRAWRRWRVTGRLASNLYASGLTSTGGSWQMNAYCSGCVTLPKWNRQRRFYVLWVRVDHWRCLLKMRHVPGDEIGFGMCSKCLPCPDCGSKTAGHSAGCEWS